MVDDAELLRRYAELRSEAAFAELVERHLKLIYFTALRRTGGDAALAQDVFSEAARKAGTLSRHSTITGWLYTTSRRAAAKFARKEQIRRRYEGEAALHDMTNADAGHDWEKLRPVIDDELDALDARDREAILLRFFEGRPFAEVGSTLRISQDAARMRVERALEKLRLRLERRGIHSAAESLGIALAAPASLALPGGLAATISAGSVGVVAASGGGAMALTFMSATKVKLTAASLLAVLATGTALVQRKRAQTAEISLAAVAQERSFLQARLARAEGGLDQANNRAAEAEKDNGALLAAVEAARAGQAALAKSPGGAGPVAAPARGEPLVHSLNALFPDGIVATVGDRTITVAEVSREIMPLIAKLQRQAGDPDEFTHRLNKLQNAAITDLLNRILFIKEFHIAGENGEARQIPVSYVDAAVADQFKEKFNNDAAQFEAFLVSRGITVAEYRKSLEEDIIYRYMGAQQRKLDSVKK